jgi:hypothetical protein
MLHLVEIHRRDLRGWETVTGVEQRLGHFLVAGPQELHRALLRKFTRATAAPTMNKGSVVDAEKFVLQIQARPVTSGLRMSYQVSRISVAWTLAARPHSGLYGTSLKMQVSCFS